jgi:hypothetical protein
MDIRDAAIRSASQGMRVFPVYGIITPGPTEAEARCTCGKLCGSPGKHPVMTGWQDAATTDHDVINKWFANGRNWNYGIALDGRDWTVTEIDPYEGGSLRALRKAVGKLGPITTSGRGHHVFFKGTNLTNGTRIGPGIAVRAAGYFVVGPGSIHYTGRMYGRRTYGFDRIDERPELVVMTFRSSSPGDVKGSPLAVPKKIPEEIFDGQGRWRHLLSVAGTLVSRGLTEATVLEAVRAVNFNQCRPPKSDTDVVRLVRYVIEQEGATEGCKEDDLGKTPPIIASPMTISEIVKAFGAATSFEEVFALFHETDPPTDPIDQLLVRRHLADVMKRWKVPLRAVDEWLSVKAAERAVSGIQFPEYEPWSEPVEGSRLVADLEAYFIRFVDAPPESILAASLWTIWTHVFDLFDIAPLLVMTSATKHCGKTTMLRLVGSVAVRPQFSSNLTGAVLFRVIEKYRPTLLIDEADNFAKFNDDLKGLLNAGHERMTALALRTVGDDHDRGGESVGISMTAESVLVKSEAARQQLDEERPSPLPEEPPEKAKPVPAEGGQPEPTLLRRFHGGVSLDPVRLSRDVAEIADAIVQHLASQPDAKVELSLEIQAKLPEGAPDSMVRTVTENARTLKFREYGFEEE